MIDTMARTRIGSWLIAAVLVALVGCGDGSAAPSVDGPSSIRGSAGAGGDAIAGAGGGAGALGAGGSVSSSGGHAGAGGAAGSSGGALGGSAGSGGAAGGAGSSGFSACANLPGGYSYDLSYCDTQNADGTVNVRKKNGFHCAQCDGGTTVITDNCLAPAYPAYVCIRSCQECQ